ncbi:Uncharacterised protein [Salmonella enterica subsp. enterica serovar Typhi]|nr:Uncharacterised protein [Salmonella enterica subsp. enterica serovar Typhi]CEV27140.1 Uncharacterised protein [Salmonella enterica subsp. enterica serovar Typhi]CGV88843.1 Uncharacterised protein [Salmonella enterica subsp. enterica serovar Typhi]CGW27738.1 Uncharacterised protein [Salmonella enterica subsp. enterica serovar Typhi]CGX07346.1 Uncharacterised protein [Salmonella enterica subsp. enterica serovar Typhi]
MVKLSKVTTSVGKPYPGRKVRAARSRNRYSPQCRFFSSSSRLRYGVLGCDSLSCFTRSRKIPSQRVCKTAIASCVLSRSFSAVTPCNAVPLTRRSSALSMLSVGRSSQALKRLHTDWSSSSPKNHWLLRLVRSFSVSPTTWHKYSDSNRELT